MLGCLQRRHLSSFCVQAAACLHENVEHETTDVVTPLGVFGRFESSAIVGLWVRVGDRDAYATRL